MLFIVAYMELQQSRVKEFMQFFGQDCPEKPVQLDEATAKLRANLILEEVFETICDGLGLMVCITDGENGAVVVKDPKKVHFIYQKQKEVDLVELADGISDISVVSYGTALAAGIDMESIDKEVFVSNMSKAWTANDLREAKDKYPTAKVEKYSETLYRLVREDGKIIKSPSYSPANLEAIIEAQKA